MNPRNNPFAGSVVRGPRMSGSPPLSGWKYYGVVGAVFGTLVLALYPILIYPILHIEEYKKAHEEAQTELFQKGMLPGQLKRWEGPSKKDI